VTLPLSLETGGLVSNAKVLHAFTVLHKTGAECVSSGRNTCDLNSDCKLMFSPSFIDVSRTPGRPQEETKTCLLLAALRCATSTADVLHW